MSQFNPSRFADVDFLSSICPSRLRRLLASHQTFFQNHGLVLDQMEGSSGMETLIHILSRPPECLPSDLMEALCSIREMATHHGMDALIADLRIQGISPAIEDAFTPADLAVFTWLEHRKLFEQRHSHLQSSKTRSYIVSEGLGSPQSFLPPDSNRLSVLTLALNKRLDSTGRGKGCWVDVQDDDGIWSFRIRRGDPYRREGCLKENGAVLSSVFYRPQVNDFLLYDQTKDELQHNISTKAVREAYLEVFGEILFGNPDYFHWGSKFTLEPLRQDGARSLACGDVPGMEEVCLKELQMSKDNHVHQETIERADDVFEALETNGGIPHGVRLIQAKFQVRFSSKRKTRTVVIRPPCKSSFTRDADASMAETWMLKRGFLRQRNTQGEVSHVAGA